MKSVSVVIPFHNRETMLQRTLNSVLQQTFRPFELILIDNNSTDKSPEIAKAFSEKAPENIEVSLLSCKKSGASAARNVGLEKVSTDYVYFFDSDDEMSANYLETVMNKATNNNCDVVICTTQMISPNGKIQARKYGFSKKASHQIVTSFLSTQSVLYATEFIKKIGGWNEKLFYWNDWELGVRMLLNHPKIIFLHGKVFHRIYSHNDSITGNNFSEHSKQILSAFLSVRLDILRYPAKDCANTLNALSRKEAIVAGIICHEGHVYVAYRLLTLLRLQHLSILQSFYCRCLYCYASKGFRGAWRLA